MESLQWVLRHVEHESLNIIIDKAYLHVGRSKGLDIPSKNINVSRNHATFILSEDQILSVKDHNTLNGTYINKIRIMPNTYVRLHEDNEVGIGVHSETPLDETKKQDTLSSARLIYIVKRTPIKRKNDDSYLDETLNIATTTVASNANIEHNLTKQDMVNDFIVISDDESSASLLNTNFDNVAKNPERLDDFLKPSTSKVKACSIDFNVLNEPDDDDEDKKPLSNEDLLRILAASQFQEDETNVNKDGAVELTNGIVKEEVKCNYTINDDFIVVSDDDENFNYSQLLDDCSVNGDHDNNADLNDTLFAAIKKEVEELDRLPDGTVFSRICIDDDESCNLFELDDNEQECKKEATLVSTSIKEKHKMPIVLLNRLSKVVKTVNSDSTKLQSRKRMNTDEAETNEEKANTEKDVPENKKRKLFEKENLQIKKIETSSFYKSPPSNPVPATKPDIKEIRKQKLKEIATKSTLERNLKKENAKQPMHVKHVKMSEGRGNFLMDAEPMPSTSKGPLVKSTKVNANIKLGKVERKKGIVIIPPHVNLPKNKSVKKNKTTNNESGTVETVTKPNMPNKDSRQKSHHNGLSRQTSIPNMKVYQELENIILEVIHWNPAWFNEYLTNPEWGLPQFILKNLHIMVDSFNSYAEYCNVVIPQMLVELWYFFYKEIDSYSDPRKKRFFSILQEEKRIPHKYTELGFSTFISKQDNDNHVYVKEDDVIILQYRRQEEDVIKAKVVIGYVIKVTKRLLQEREDVDRQFAKFIEVIPHARVNFQVLVKSSPGKAIIGRYGKVRVVTSVVSAMRIFKSVYRLKDSLLQPHILKPTKKLYRIPPVAKHALCAKGFLNKEQKKAVLEASVMCLGDLPGIYLIQGPPGTGKTTVILHIIQEILFQPNNSSHRCILVVAPSNGAVDELAIRIMGLKSKFAAVRRKLKLVRMGPKNVVHPKVQDYLLYEIAKRNLHAELMNTVSQSNLKVLQSKYKTFVELRELANNSSADNTIIYKLNSAKLEFEKACKRNTGGSYNEQVRKHEEKLLSGAEIICTTLSSCAGLRMEEVFARTSNNNITCCIVDEATQSNEQETLIPLILGVNKIVLVGDPKQLPAVTQTKEAKDFGYGKSLFSRIMSNFPSDEGNPVQLLTTQYRMHPEISRFPNTVFYNGKLTNSNSVKMRKSIFSSLKPYLVFNFDMEAIMNSQEYSNKAEILCVLKLLNALNQKLASSSNFSIGIITPYNHQRTKIREELELRSFGSNVTVNTVDSFQGQEKDVIIMSCVRESTNNFLTDEQRLNVALTRARHALYIIGSSSLFKSSGIFGIIRDDACKRKLFIKVNSRTGESQLLNYITKEENR